MKSINSITVGVVLSALLAGAAGTFYWLTRSNDPEDYRRAAAQVRQIQQLASEWSVETARTRSDPLADYDALAAFIPEMRTLKNRLLASVRGIPGIPDNLANDVSAYVSALDAKEERIERFKTANSVIRNSVRFLPVAASTVVQNPAADAELSRDVRTLASGLNEYAAAPTDATKGRLTAVLDRLVDRLGEPEGPVGDLADAVASFASHAQVLLDRQAPTQEIFEQATANDVSNLSTVLVADLDGERRTWEDRRETLMRGVWGAAAAAVLLWILIAVMRGSTAASPRASVPAGAAPDVRPAAIADGAGAALPAPSGELVPAAEADAHLANGAATEDPTAEFEKRLMAQRIVVDTIAGRIAEASRAIAGDAAAIDGDEEARARLSAEAERVAELAEGLSRASGGPEARYALVDLNDCVREAVRAADCESVAEVILEPGEAPELFACPNEICLMLEKVLENSVQSIRDKHAGNGAPEDGKGEIRIATAGDGGEARLTVIDNGVGMSAEETERMFEPLYAGRGDRPGMGLTVTAHLVAKYSGRISASSHAGAGAVTRIVLPGMADQ